MDKEKAIKTAEEYLKIVNTVINIKSAFLFGSYVHGTQRIESDIDIGIFTDKLQENYFDILKKLYKLRKSIDVRIEPHLFIIGSDKSGFSEEVIKTGIKI